MKENALIGPTFNRGTNMHVIPMEMEKPEEEHAIAPAGSSIAAGIAAILGAVLIGIFFVKKIKYFLLKFRKII